MTPLAFPRGPAPSLTERGLRFLRPQLRDVPWWRLTIEGENWCLAYVLPEPDRSDPVEPVAAALWYTPTGIFWATYRPAHVIQGEGPDDFLGPLRTLIDVLRLGHDPEPGYPPCVAVVVSERSGRSERNPGPLSESVQLLLLALSEEGAIRVERSMQAALVAADTRMLAWPRPKPIVKKPEPIERPEPTPDKPKTIRRPKR